MRSRHIQPNSDCKKSNHLPHGSYFHFVPYVFHPFIADGLTSKPSSRHATSLGFKVKKTPRTLEMFKVDHL
ncbi:hypothetical protein L1887_35326 [Cichorium endivia]|nr:hypothetical protein L1887_35326 [Cichorium endivia]